MAYTPSWLLSITDQYLKLVGVAKYTQCIYYNDECIPINELKYASPSGSWRVGV